MIGILSSTAARRRLPASLRKSPRLPGHARGDATPCESAMTSDRTMLCYAIAAATAFFTAFGVQLRAGIATGDLARAFGRELVDLGDYWLVALPVCYAAAGVLGYLGPVRTWRWILTMIAVHSVYMMLTSRSGLSLLPLALIMTTVICLPGFVTGWLGGLVRRCQDLARLRG